MFGSAAGGAAGGRAAAARQRAIEADLHREFPDEADYQNAVALWSLIEKAAEGAAFGTPLLSFFLAFVGMMCAPVLLESLGFSDAIQAAGSFGAIFLVFGLGAGLNHWLFRAPARRRLHDFVASLPNGPEMESRVRDVLKNHPS